MNFRFSNTTVSLLLALAVSSSTNADVPRPATQPSVTIAVTGDIKAWPQRKAVSDAILADATVKAVLLVGDTYNNKGSILEKYKEVYAGTYDRFLDRIYPCPGNHDQQADPPYSGYRAFWKEAARWPVMYYSFDLNGWHIVSLNSVSVTEDKEAAARRLEWLKKDLAAHPGVPVIAFWHYPLFSSNPREGEKRMKPLWEILHAHGPALVFNGHTHVYERYEPMDPQGNACPPHRGIQQFIIGPGGSKPGGKQRENPRPPLPVKYSGEVQHVGFFTLFAEGGYRFTIQGIDKENKVLEIDKGEGKLAP